MENRGQKRTETADELPADKRACSSLEFRPSSSVSSVRTIGADDKTHDEEIHDADMETSSSTSGSSPSFGEEDRYSPSGSCDSRNSNRDYYGRRSSSDHSKFGEVLSKLSEDQGESEQLATLTELCELLSFCTDSSLSGHMADSFAPVLVRLAGHETNPDIMLLAIRAITYFCDVHPRASSFLVRHDVVPALCERLMAIEYLDVAEQCLQALAKISREQPLVCLQSGAIVAVLSYIDFFSTSIQRVAVSTVLNICKRLPSEYPSQLMDTVPLLCNLLQYEDRQLVESVTTSLIKIAEKVCSNHDMVDELCKHGLIQQFANFLNSNGRNSLSQSVYLSLIGLLVKLASGSILAISILYEINISSTLKDILASHDLSHGISSNVMVDGQSNQVHEVLKLLNELLPSNTDNQLDLEKETFLTSQPSLMQRFGLDVLPVLVQVVNSGMNLYVCYGCLTVIYKLVYFSRSDMLLEFLQSTNISSFLAGVFTRKDLHILLLALRIVEAVLQKHANIFLDSFIKEGVLFAIDSLLSPERCSLFMFPSCNDVQFLHDTTQKSLSRGVGCLCFSFNLRQSQVTTEALTCKLEKDSIKSVAENIKNNYFGTELLDTQKGFTDIFQKLQTLSIVLTDLVNNSASEVDFDQDEEQFYPVLQQIMSVLGGKDPISTFEFVESGIVKSLLNYLFNGQYVVDKAENQRVYQIRLIEKRFEMLGKLLVYIPEMPFENSILTTLISRLQSALSSMETFPVILSQGTKLRESYAAIPYGRATSYPCLRVQFLKGEEEDLSDYSKDTVSVDPFSTMDSIVKYLWSKISLKGINNDPNSENEASEEKECSPSQSPSCASPSQGRSVDTMASDSFVSHANEIQDTLERTQEGSNNNKRCPGCTNSEDTSPELLLYLDGKELDHTLTLYQALVQQKITSENNWIPGAELWNQLYEITYRRAFDVNKESPEPCSCYDCPSYGLVGAPLLYPAFFSSILPRDLVSLNQSSSTYDILYLLRCVEGINRFRFHMMSRERIYAFSKERIGGNLDTLKVTVPGVPQSEFVSSRITEKFEQQMRDALAVSVGGIPSWCSKLMVTCPFLFGFETKCKYFHLAAFNKHAVQSHTSHHDDVGSLSGSRQYGGSHARKKFLVHRDRILDSATEMMNLHAHRRVVLEVEYKDEVGTGLGPTLEFYTLVCHEFQKSRLCLWREDHSAVSCLNNLDTEGSRNIVAPLGLFPRPCSDKVQTSNGTEFSEVTEKFVLLGQVVAKALQDGRVLDLPFSKAFYKLILGKELTVYDIQSFDPELGRALLEFQALVEKKRCLDSGCQDKSSAQSDMSFHGTNIEDLCLEFCVPGYPDYSLDSVSGSKMVSLSNLEEYVSLVADATIKTGISRQFEAFKSGFEQVFPISHLQIFHEDEFERLLCGECELWNSNDLSDHIKFDHGYTASSPPIVNLLEIMQEFDHEQQSAFLRFVTGAPRLPPGGLAALNPSLTIVRKHGSKCPDADLPSVMTCANYLKLPPYSSKVVTERMKEKLLYAIKEGQHSFHLS